MHEKRPKEGTDQSHMKGKLKRCLAHPCVSQENLDDLQLTATKADERMNEFELTVSLSYACAWSHPPCRYSPNSRIFSHYTSADNDAYITFMRNCNCRRVCVVRVRTA